MTLPYTGYRSQSKRLQALGSESAPTILVPASPRLAAEGEYFCRHDWIFAGAPDAYIEPKRKWHEDACHCDRR